MCTRPAGSTGSSQTESELVCHGCGDSRLLRMSRSDALSSTEQRIIAEYLECLTSIRADTCQTDWYLDRLRREEASPRRKRGRSFLGALRADVETKVQERCAEKIQACESVVDGFCQTEKAEAQAKLESCPPLGPVEEPTKFYEGQHLQFILAARRYERCKQLVSARLSASG